MYMLGKFVDGGHYNYGKSRTRFTMSAPSLFSASRVANLSIFFDLRNATRVQTVWTRRVSTLRPRLPTDAVLDEYGRMVLANHDVYIRNVSGRGRGLFTNRAVSAGDVVLTEAPLIAVAYPQTMQQTCQHCFRQLGSSYTTCGCGNRYCSNLCRDSAMHLGHDALCGAQTAALNDFCLANRMNFPRTAAAVVARSVSASADFGKYWESVNRLVSVMLPDDDAFPAAYTQSYGLVVAALGQHMGGDPRAFFDHVFNLRTYARLMGTLRLNSFSVRCPIDGEPPAVPDSVPSPATALPPLDDASSGGCCSSDPASSPSSCGTDPSACDSSTTRPSVFAEPGDAPGGTALYSTCSLVNHACEPSLDVVMSPGGDIALRARRDLREGDELTITYLDSSMPVALRRRRLYHNYGFECGCDMCRRQLEEEKQPQKRTPVANT